MSRNNQFTPRNVKHPRARWQWWCRNILLRKKRERLKNRNFSVISCNCLGAMVVHDLLQPQLSPTVNLYMQADDFVRFLSNIKEYLRLELVEYFGENKSYPVGLLGDVKIFFVHYKSFEDAKKKWNERCSRINWDNLFVIFAEREGCTKEHLLLFDKLPYKNKIVIVHKPYLDIQSAYYFPGYEKESELGEITKFEGPFGKRIYDKWDFVSFLNKK